MDLPVNKLDGTGIPEPFGGITLSFDLPLNPSEENLWGEDLTHDGYPDPNLFLRTVEHDLWATSLSAVASTLIRIYPASGKVTPCAPFTSPGHVLV